MFRVGMVGIGSIAGSHQLGMRASGMFELIRVCGGNNLERLQARSIEWDVLACENYDVLLEDDSLDCIVIASPPDVHYDQARKALLRRKHVLVEKPVCLRVEDIVALDEISRHVGRVCMPGHSGIYDPGVLRMIDMVKSKDIGDVVFSRFYKTFVLDQVRALGWRSNRKAAGGGILLDMGTHFAYLMQAMFGLPDEVHAFVSPSDEASTETTAVLTARYQQGHLSTMQVSSIIQNDSITPWLAIGGTAGQLVHSDKLYANGRAIVGTERVNNFDMMYKMFAKVIQGECESISTVNDAASALKIIEAGYESVRQRQVVPIVS